MKSISREEQLERLRRRYQGRGPKGKAQLLDYVCEEFGYHRKHAIRLLNAVPQPKESPPGPEPKYEPMLEIVEQIWAAGEQPCGKRLVQMLPLWLPHYQRRYRAFAAQPATPGPGSQRGHAGSFVGPSAQPMARGA